MSMHPSWLCLVTYWWRCHSSVWNVVGWLQDGLWRVLTKLRDPPRPTAFIPRKLKNIFAVGRSAVEAARLTVIHPPLATIPGRPEATLDRYMERLLPPC